MAPALSVSSPASYSHARSKRCVIGIHGSWYDVTDFIPQHPGGDLLWKFAGLDATEVFVSFHPRGGVLKQVAGCKVGSYTRTADPVKTEYARMARAFVKAGFLSTSTSWLVINLSRVAALFALMLWLVLSANQFVLGGLALALFWQQCGGFLHDCMHSNLTYNMTLDGWLGWLFGTVAIGINSDWWKREHDLHHALVNAYTTAPETQSSFARDYGVPDAVLVHPEETEAAKSVPPGPSEASSAVEKRAADLVERRPRSSSDARSSSPSSTQPHELGLPVLPLENPRNVVQAYAVDIQMKEDIWAQALDVWLLSYQHIYFLPAVFFLGRIGILINAWKHERTVRQWSGFVIHFAATAVLFSYLPSWRDVAVFYATAAVGEGVLHMQLIINHYINEWGLDENVAHDFVRWTCQVTHNVPSPRWLDWFHVGLHLHIEHHLFPKVARCHFRAIQPAVKDFAAKHGMPYRELPFARTPFELYRSFAEGAASVCAVPDPIPDAEDVALVAE
ncbi:delta-6-fatty acid desaturase [Thecamonas trahens ATCC 50062]|uniref:Delta-6-fatty acid desaturase n=1 Tax=Thecamonas trahens ATCC 50062 TaxID=461836 RepID=A0A0L0DE35_THETB|nr:delta-6-fatty acid desaturase [Thecamonas trahens ATCC 50062]KNC50572.1 delta-6-fatty acid desaturase [Thecamonas trahens ATCC 50062]|eukprot:XP_013762462.1 delta-6-fatty acid desaturase [Thecamonas trahens ATCC 50062]